MLVGGSLLLISASAVALLLGWAAAEEALIWASIAASVGAGVLLALAYTRSRTEASAVTNPSAPSPSASPDPDATALLEGATSGPPGPPRMTAGSGPTAARMEAPSRPGAPVSSPPIRQSKPQVGSVDEDVVAVPAKKKFHRPDCRYAKTPGAEKMSKAAARGRSYAPCGICKP